MSAASLALVPDARDLASVVAFVGGPAVEFGRAALATGDPSVSRRHAAIYCLEAGGAHGEACHLELTVLSEVNKPLYCRCTATPVHAAGAHVWRKAGKAGTAALAPGDAVKMHSKSDVAYTVVYTPAPAAAGGGELESTAPTSVPGTPDGDEAAAAEAAPPGAAGAASAVAAAGAGGLGVAAAVPGAPVAGAPAAAGGAVLPPLASAAASVAAAYMGPPLATGEQPRNSSSDGGGSGARTGGNSGGRPSSPPG